MVFGGTTLGDCNGDLITGGAGMTVTFSSMAASSIMSCCGAGTLCYGTWVGWVCNLFSGTGFGWGDVWGRGKARWRKIGILLYEFCISKPYLSEGIVFSFFIDRMARTSEDV